MSVPASAFTHLRRFVLALFILASGAGAALAGASSAASPAWTIADASLLAGPASYAKTVGSVDAGKKVWVDRCYQVWCEIDTGTKTGWVKIEKLSFGQVARGPFSGPKLGLQSGGSGKVCFYTGTGFTGASVCRKAGFVVRDLKPAGLDNQFRSVKISGANSALVCRDAFFGSYCVIVTKNTPALPGLLSGQVSSVHVF